MADIIRLFDSAVTAARDRAHRRGQIGRINASGPPTVMVPGSGGRLVYVRLGGGADGVIEAVPRNVSLRAHVYVRVRREDKQWIAVADESAINQNGSGNSSVGPHTHRRHSGNEFIWEPELFAPGVVLPAGGLTVSIGRFRYPNSGNGETYEGGTLDLTSHVPATAGKWRWLVIGVDPDTNAAVAVSGSDFDTQAELTLAEIDNVTFTGDIPLAAIQVANGDTALTDHSRYYDARPWFVPADDGAIPSHDHEDAAGGGQLDHGLALTGLTDDDHTQYALLAGRSGGQVGYGGTGDGDALTLAGSSHANGGPVLLQPDGGNVSIGKGATPSEMLVVGDDLGSLSSPTALVIGDTDGNSTLMFGQSGSNAAAFNWVYNATPANAKMQFLTLGYSNPFEIDASQLRLQAFSHGNVGIDDDNPAAKLSVKQSSTTAAIEVLRLQQNDASEPMIRFIATVGTGNAIENKGAKTLTVTEFVKIQTPNGIRYVQAGTIA